MRRNIFTRVIRVVIAAVIAGTCLGAASASSSASAMSTATTRDTPGSGIVIPMSWDAISMVILLWLMKTN